MAALSWASYERRFAAESGSKPSEALRCSCAGIPLASSRFYSGSLASWTEALWPSEDSSSVPQLPKFVSSSKAFSQSLKLFRQRRA